MHAHTLITHFRIKHTYLHFKFNVHKIAHLNSMYAHTEVYIHRLMCLKIEDLCVNVIKSQINSILGQRALKHAVVMCERGVFTSK